MVTVYESNLIFRQRINIVYDFIRIFNSHQFIGYHKICSGCKCKHTSQEFHLHLDPHYSLKSCQEMCDAKPGCIGMEYYKVNHHLGKCYECTHHLHTIFRRRTSRSISSVWRKGNFKYQFYYFY